MTHIEIDHLTLSLPTNSNELTARQLLFLARQAREPQSLEAVKLKFLLFCTGAKIERERACFVIDRQRFFLTAEQLVEITSHLDYLFSAPDTNNNCRLEPTHYIQKFPHLTIGKQHFVGCSDALNSLTYEQFVMLQTYAEQPNKLNHLLAILYTPKGEPYNLDTLDLQSLILNGLMEEIKQITLWYYHGSLKFIARKFPRLFSGNNKGGNSFDLQMQLIDTLADGDVTKKPDVRKALLYDVLYTLDNTITKNEALTRQSR